MYICYVVYVYKLLYSPNLILDEDSKTSCKSCPEHFYYSNGKCIKCDGLGAIAIRTVSGKTCSCSKYNSKYGKRVLTEEKTSCECAKGYKLFKSSTAAGDKCIKCYGPGAELVNGQCECQEENTFLIGGQCRTGFKCPDGSIEPNINRCTCPPDSHKVTDDSNMRMECIKCDKNSKFSAKLKVCIKCYGPGKWLC